MLLLKIGFNLEKFMLPCMNKWLFGFDCPGCGMQRSVSLLLHGRFTDAFQMFPAIYSLIFLLVLLGLHLTDKSRNYERAVVTVAIINALVIIISYIYKLIN
ncbi:MAG: DUF2752 domain-containing protein [Flavobacterium sp.]|nr:MAG: DUF2752 domain-containing protein [Flavobacterium sp.]